MERDIAPERKGDNQSLKRIEFLLYADQEIVVDHQPKNNNGNEVPKPVWKVYPTFVLSKNYS